MEKLLLNSDNVTNKVEWLGSRADLHNRLLGDTNFVDADFDVQVTLQNVRKCQQTLTIRKSHQSPKCFVLLKKTKWFST
jgi:hypothetical protein